MKITRYAPDRIEDDPAATLPKLLSLRDGALWIDMLGPSEADLRVLREVFKFHPLAIEDTQKQRQRPKLEEYEGYFFLTIHATHAGKERGSGIVLEEVDIFFGSNYLVTVHPRPVAALEEARTRLGHAGAALRSQPDYILYTIVDSAVDTYFPVIDRIDSVLERLEDQLFKRPTAKILDQIFALRRALQQMRRVAVPLRDLILILTRRDLPMIRSQTLLYFRDIYDHLLRITDMVDTHRDLITGALEIYLSAISNRLNEVMKVLTVITAIVGPLAVITGIYGMNFQRTFPPFDWRYGFGVVVGAMLIVIGVMLAAFRRLRWL